MEFSCFCKVARKLAMVEADLERAEERAEQGEKYVQHLSQCLYYGNNFSTEKLRRIVLK